MSTTSTTMVLNVQDDAATRSSLTGILRSGGYTVLEAADGQTALSTIATERPDLVLLDINLPDISGLEVCRRIKSDPATATVLVIHTSARASSGDRKVEGLENGADAYLAQPIEPLELLATVRAMLRTRSAEEAERKASRLETELKARVEELAETGRRKDEFLGMLAHELRNPLHAISAAASVLDRTGPESLARPRAIIHRQVAILARLVDDLLEVSRVTRGTLQLRCVSMDMAQIVRQAAQASRATLESRGQELTVITPEAPLWLDGDDLRLEQVVTNLLSNASKFSAPGGAITVELRERWDGDARLAELSVQDQGVGIPPNMLSKIFEPFVQVDQSLARSLGGLGIGLSMVKNLVELHGGSVLAKSPGLGKGAEFVVHVPAKSRTRVEEVPAAGRMSSIPAAREGENKAELRVLVVEDNEDTLELVQMWLRSLGHEVRGASDGNSGLESALNMQPDVALVDIGLPGIDGYEVARSVRASDVGRGIYMVAVTGYGRPEDRARALDAGFDAYIVKPLDVAGLKRALAPRNLAQRRAQRERADETL